MGVGVVALEVVVGLSGGGSCGGGGRTCWLYNSGQPEVASVGGKSPLSMHYFCSPSFSV